MDGKPPCASPEEEVEKEEVEDEKEEVEVEEEGAQ